MDSTGRMIFPEHSYYLVPYSNYYISHFNSVFYELSPFHRVDKTMDLQYNTKKAIRGGLAPCHSA